MQHRLHQFVQQGGDDLVTGKVDIHHVAGAVDASKRQLRAALIGFSRHFAHVVD